MSKAFRILLIALLVVAAGVWLDATGVAPMAAVAQVTPAAPAQAAAPAEAEQAETPAPPAPSAAPAAPQAGAKVVMAGSGFGGGSYLGIDSQDVTKERLAALKLKEERGVEVLMVDADAPAGKAGLKEHDVILEFNGARLESVEQLRRLIRETPAGRSVTLGISRDGQPLTLTATLAERSKHYSMSYSVPKVKLPKVVVPKIEMPDMREFSFVLAGSSRSGLLVENLTPQLGEFFGVKDGAGVLVRSVEKGSPAEAAGFKAGDIIIRVEKDKVADRGDWRSTMRSHRSGKVSVGIIRDKREQTLSLALPEVKEQSSVWRLLDPEELDMDGMDFDLDEMEINRLGPELERLKPEMERLKPQMDRLRKELSGQLTASLAQGSDELRKAMAQARPDSIGAALDTARAEAAQALDAQRKAMATARPDSIGAALQKARQEAQRALAGQRRELEKARQKMQRQAEMY